VRPDRRPTATAVAGALCISTSAIVMKLAGSSASMLALGRSGFALPVLGLLVWLERRDTLRRTGKRGPRLSSRARWLARIAGVFLAADLIMWSHSIDEIGAGLSTVLSNLQVLIVAGAGWLLLGERPRRSLFAAAPVMVLGLLLVGGVFTGGGYGADPALGVVYGIGVAVFYSVYILLLRQAAQEGHGRTGSAAPGGNRRTGSPALGGNGGTGGRAPAGNGGTGSPPVRGRGLVEIVPPEAAETLFEATLGGVVGAAVLGAALRDFRLGPAWPALGWLVVLALTSGVIGWLLLTISMPRLPAWLASSLLLVQPAGSVVLGAVFLRERPTLPQLAGVVIMLGGVLIATRGAGGTRQTSAIEEPLVVYEPDVTIGE
jgi:drug/metabolite transporter (DMT)-like permease